MTERELIQMLQRNVKSTLSHHLGNDGVVEELSRRAAINLAALLAIVEIEEKCPLCGLNMPGDMDAQALYAAIAESMKKTADTRIAVEGIPREKGAAIYLILDELARNTSQAVLGYLFEQQKKMARLSETAEAISNFGKEGSSHEE